MKRDLDLVREILMWIEEQPEGRNVNTWKFDLPGRTAKEIGYHAYLMHQAGLIIAYEVTPMESDTPIWLPSMLTWHGHEFIAAARDNTIWQQAKRKMMVSGAGIAFSLISDLLKDEAKRRLGIGVTSSSN